MTLTAATDARAAAALAKVFNWTDGTTSSVVVQFTGLPMTFSTIDGMIDYSRTKFNRMGSNAEQDAYMAKLKAQTYYLINDTIVAKLVHDHFRTMAEDQ
jgi:hypothetical protein